MSRYRKLGRASEHRMMMFRNMTTDFLRNGKMITTLSRAKELEKFASQMITLAKRNDLHSRRQAAAFILDKTVLNKLFTEYAEDYKERNGGYTRIYKLGPRRGDGSMMVQIELV